MNYCPSMSVPDDNDYHSPESDAILEILERLAVDPAEIDLIMAQVELLESQITTGCMVCEARAMEAEIKAWEESQKNDPLKSWLCPHGAEWTQCNPCLVESDIAYDAAREKRMR